MLHEDNDLLGICRVSLLLFVNEVLKILKMRTATRERGVYLRQGGLDNDCCARWVGGYIDVIKQNLVLS